MAQFSGAVKLGDLNDFINPSQACVVSLKGTRLDAKTLAEPEPGQVQRQKPRPPAKPSGWSQMLPAQDGEALKISLQDCLACAGCVTSAETVLLQHQSTEEMLAKLQQPDQTVIASISPQTRASLAAAHGLSPAQAFRKITHFLKSLGVRYVLDTSCSRDLSLLESAAEFVQRYRTMHTGASRAAAAAALAAQRDRLSSNHAAQTSGRDSAASAAECHLPVLASACPGWICYAEKTHGDYILPYISAVKSPQAVMGTLVKRWLAPRLGLQPSQVYHCAVMPCYDKKLEASREDFVVPGTQVPETDCGLTSIELQQLLDQRGVDLAALPEAPLDQVLVNTDEDGRVYGVPGGAGGYLEFVFRTAATELFGQEVPPGPLPMKAQRNADHQLVTLGGPDGRPALRFALAYGFRNIQTLVRKVKRRACDLDYIEVMACPSGCLNGGGQLKPRPGQRAVDLIAELEQVYHDPEIIQRHPRDNPTVQALYADWVGAEPGSAPAQDLLHTGYHQREKTVTSMLGDW